MILLIIIILLLPRAADLIQGTDRHGTAHGVLSELLSDVEVVQAHGVRSELQQGASLKFVDMHLHAFINSVMNLCAFCVNSSITYSWRRCVVPADGMPCTESLVSHASIDEGSADVTEIQ